MQSLIKICALRNFSGSKSKNKFRSNYGSFSVYIYLGDSAANDVSVSNIIHTNPLLNVQLPNRTNSIGFSGGTTIEFIAQVIARSRLINLKNGVMHCAMNDISDNAEHARGI